MKITFIFLMLIALVALGAMSIYVWKFTVENKKKRNIK